MTKKDYKKMFLTALMILPLFAVGVVSGVPSVYATTGILDQVCDPVVDRKLGIGVDHVGQIFIPTVDNIVRVDLVLLTHADSDPGKVKITLRADNIYGEILGTAEYYFDPLLEEEWTHFNFDDPVPLIPGNTYAIQYERIDPVFAALVGVEEDLCTGFATYPFVEGEIPPFEIQLIKDYLYRTYSSDTIPPVITCPNDVIINEGDSTDPSNTGEAAATDNSGETPSIGHIDAPTDGGIIRTWTGTDGSENTSSCDQSITILSPEEQIDNLVEGVDDLGLEKGKTNSLNKKLVQAINNLTNNDPTDDAEACEKLQSFIDQLEAFVNAGKIDDENIDDVEVLIGATEDLIEELC